MDAAVAIAHGRELGYALGLDPLLATAVAKDLAHNPTVDPEQVRALCDKSGHDYDELLRLAGSAFARGELRVVGKLSLTPAQLPAHSLIQIALTEQVRARREGR